MKEVMTSNKVPADRHSVPGGNGAGSLEQIQNMSKPTHVEGAEASHQAAHQAPHKENTGKVPYCFRCKTKGHAIESCNTTMHCEICDIRDHFKSQCTKFQTVKHGAVPCGYDVEGLGFFHISHDIVSKNDNDAHSAMIHVTERNFQLKMWL
jgi:hypothetical protein